MSLVHVDGSSVELRVVENNEKTHRWDFNLHVSSTSFTLMIAFQHFISCMLESVPIEGEQFKRILEFRLSKLRELKQAIDLYPNFSGKKCKEDAIARLHNVTVELRSFIL